MKQGNPNKFKKQYIKQVNNLRIYFTPWFLYHVETKHHEVLTNHFSTIEEAEQYCRQYHK